MENKVLSCNYWPTSRLGRSPHYCNYLEMLREFHLILHAGLLAQYVRVCVCVGGRKRQTDRNMESRPDRANVGTFPCSCLS